MENLTIIITSFNRPKCLYRLLSFLLSFKKGFKIIIADSSFPDQDFSQVKSLDFQNRVNFQRFKSDVKVAEKISKSLNFVETEFSVLCAEDDFIIPTSVETCIQFLKKNPDYSSCHGKYYVHSSSEYTRKFGIVFRELSKATVSCEYENPLDRIQFYLDGKIGPQYTFYAVFKTNNLKKTWQQTYFYANNWLINEYFPCIISLILGKMKTLPIFYMSREPNTKNWINKERVKLILSEKNNFFYSEGILENLKRENVKGIDENTKKNYFKIFETKRENMINNEVNFKPINENNIFKSFFRIFYYFYLKQKLIYKKTLKIDIIKQIEKLIIETDNVAEEIIKSRDNY